MIKAMDEFNKGTFPDTGETITVYLYFKFCLASSHVGFALNDLTLPERVYLSTCARETLENQVQILRKG